jgi:hypothetical protein
VFDASGNLYGTTTDAGGRYPGTVFQLSPPIVPGGSWTEFTIHFFDGVDGAFPVGSLIMNNDGTLFGTTQSGGNHTCPNASDSTCGLVFQLRPPASPGGHWTSEVIYEFTGGTDGGNPNYGGLAFGYGLAGQSRIYGATFGLVPSNNGVVYQITQ